MASMSLHAAITRSALPEWSLDDLYAGRKDPRIEADLKAAEAAAAELKRLEGAFVSARGNADRLGLLLSEGIGQYERTANLLGAVGAFAGLQASVARDDPEAAKFEADLRQRLAQIGAETLFFTLELNQLEEWEMEAAFRARPEAERWRPWLRRVRKMRPHELKPDLERLLIDRAPQVANWSRLFDETLARLKVEADGETLTLSEA
jgi:oligoendopeptidase F